MDSAQEISQVLRACIPAGQRRTQVASDAAGALAAELSSWLAGVLEAARAVADDAHGPSEPVTLGDVVEAVCADPLNGLLFGLFPPDSMLADLL
jgi:hypothetical protein